MLCMVTTPYTEYRSVTINYVLQITPALAVVLNLVVAVRDFASLMTEVVPVTEDAMQDKTVVKI